MYDALVSPGVQNAYGLNDGGEQKTLMSEHIASVPPTQSVGKAASKKRLYVKDVLIALLSLACLAAGVAVVADENVSWMLARGSDQLIVIGFLLSIMNLCLGSVLPVLYFHIEARFGSSLLQNYDGIIRNQVMTSRLGYVWRLVLVATIALPIGLSAAYKSFLGGESTKEVDIEHYATNVSYYGLFGTPDVQLTGKNVGLSLFYNATQAFMVTSSPGIDGKEPALPGATQPFGSNLLYINDTATAALDMPQPEFVTAVQGLLALGESWNITADVLGIVAVANKMKTADPDAFTADTTSFCQRAVDNSSTRTDKPEYHTQTMYNDWVVGLMSNSPPRTQALQYIALLHQSEHPELPGFCSNFSRFAQRIDVSRRPCRGTWSVTRGGIQLAEGRCNDTELPAVQQLVLTNNPLNLGMLYIVTLTEFLGMFATERYDSAWKVPSMTTAVASMIWSRVTGLNGVFAARQAGRATDLYTLTKTSSAWDAGLIYPSRNASMRWIRPTLVKSRALYFVLACQPMLLCLALLVIAILNSTPVDRGFGLVSILSGIDRDCLDSLQGAALSGELQKRMKLVISPRRDGEDGAIEYRVSQPKGDVSGNGRLERNVVYY